MSSGMRFTEEQLAAMVKKSHVRVVEPMKPKLAPSAAPAPKKPPSPKSEQLDHARALAAQIRDAQLLQPTLEYAFDHQLDGGGRGWRFDLCWPESRLVIEVDGAVHRIHSRFKSDIEKHQRAFFLGYRVLRVSPAQVRSGEALELVRRVLEAEAK